MPKNYELTVKIVDVARTSKTVPGGRTFSFRALVVVGDAEKNRVGYGIGKALEPTAAVEKATQAAKQAMKNIHLRDGTIQHEIKLKHGSTRIFLKPASQGTGLIAGGAMRSVLEVLGIENVQGKVYGSSSPMNVVAATIQALASMDTPLSVAKRRGKLISEIFGNIKQEEGA